MVKDRDKADTRTPLGLCLCDRPYLEDRRGEIAQKSRDPCAAQVLPMHPGSQRAGRKGRKTFWTYSTRLCLRHVGDVTVVLSKKGRNTWALSIPKSW